MQKLKNNLFNQIYVEMATKLNKDKYLRIQMHNELTTNISLKNAKTTGATDESSDIGHCKAIMH